jgi:flagellin
MLAIKQNMVAQGTARTLGFTYEKVGVSIERLSTGLRINSAKDDAAGLAVRELIRSDIASIRQASRNALDGVSMLQSAEGALQQVDEILNRMRELAEQACTDMYSAPQKQIMQDEFDELAVEITRICETTDFNDVNLLSRSTGSILIGLGGSVADTGRSMAVEKQDMRAEALGLIGQRESAVANGTHAVTPAGSTETYFTNSDGANSAMLVFLFDGHTLSLNFAAGESKTLDEVVNELNAQSNALEAGWDVATVQETPGHKVMLHLEAHNRGDIPNLTLANSDSDIVWGSGGAVVADDGSDFEITSGSDSLDLSADDNKAIDAVDEAIRLKEMYRAKLGNYMNRLEYSSKILDIQAENLTHAESRIADVDVAKESSDYMRNQILAQSGVSMLAQANSLPELALRLLE